MAIATPIAVPGETLTFSVISVDEDGVAPSITVEEDLPSGMLISGLGNGILDFTWPVPADLTDPVTITVVAIDAIEPTSRVSMDVVIEVAPLVLETTDSETDVDSGSEIGSEQPDTSAPVELSVPGDQSDAVVNQVPVLITPSNQSVMVGERLQIPVLAIDPDGFVPSIWSDNLPEGATLNDAGNGMRLLAWTPEPSQRGLHVIDLLVQDAIDPSIINTWEISLEVVDQTIDTAPLFSSSDSSGPINFAPIFPAIGAQNAQVGQEFVLAVQPIDPEGIAPHLQLVNALTNAQFSDDNNGGRILRWTPTADELGVTVLRFVATDNDDETLRTMLEVEVTVF